VNTDEIYRRIQQLKRELDALITVREDLHNPEVRAKGEEINRLISMYQNLTGANSQVHSETSGCAS